MTNGQEIIKAMLKPLNVKCRTFQMDYQDKNGVYLNTELLMPITPSSKDVTDEFIVNYILQDYRANGFTVAVIAEWLDGYSSNELEKLSTAERGKHIKFLYFDATTDYLA